jgi:hypothetical protein
VQESQGPDPQTLTALSQLLDKLSEPAARKQFFADPSQQVSELPENVQRFFSDLSYDELRVLVRTCDEMKKAGLAYDLPGGGRVCFL